jgi:Arc/MetJ-type ribon-helix-helix transcriptional regulator
MARPSSKLAKKSLVVNPEDLRHWTRIGGFRTESEAVRDAVAKALAIRKMQDAVASLQRRGTFGRHLG